MKNFLNKYTKDIWYVFATTAFLVYSWSIVVIFWDLPALLLRMTRGDIVSYIAYQFMYMLFESLLVTLVIFALSFFLPTRFLRDNLSVSGSLLICSLGMIVILTKALPRISSWLLANLPLNEFILYQFVFGIYLLLIVLLPIYALLLARNASISRGSKNFIGRLFPLIGMYTTISIFSLLVVIYRNIW